jgi:hypothetical protein
MSYALGLTMKIHEEFVLKISTLPLWGRIDELKKTTYRITKFSDASYKISKYYFIKGKRKSNNKRLQNSRKLDSYIKQLKRINLPAFPDDVDGCDGALTTITYKEGFIESSFQWWICPPDSWKVLDQLTSEIIDFLEM